MKLLDFLSRVKRQKKLNKELEKRIYYRRKDGRFMSEASAKRLSTYRKNKEIRRRKQNISDAKLALKIFILIMLAASLAKIVSYYIEKGL